MIGYGAMLCEGLVGCVALIAVCALHPGDYYAINVPPAVVREARPVDRSTCTHFSSAGRRERWSDGPAARCRWPSDSRRSSPASRSSADLMSYWYHFAIMFEALFILTTIDTGTRVARFLVQEFLGRAWKPFENTTGCRARSSRPALVVFGWAYFILTGSISQIWPMFGIANQLLAAVALCVGTTVILNAGRAKYAWTTMFPLAFVASTTLYAGWRSIFDNFLARCWPRTRSPATSTRADRDPDALRDRDPGRVGARLDARGPRRAGDLRPRHRRTRSLAHSGQRLLLGRARTPRTHHRRQQVQEVHVADRRG